MDERVKALTESDDWIFPPWPELERRPMGLDSAILEPATLSPSARKSLRKWFADEERVAAISATREAIAWYRWDVAHGWSWKG